MRRPGSTCQLLFAIAVASGGCNAKPSANITTTTVTDLPTDLPAGDLFRDVTAQSGIAFTYQNGEDLRPPHLSILESLGGGIGLIDFDGDGRVDIYQPGGGFFTGHDKKQISGHTGRLFRNLDGLRFADVTNQVGLASLAGERPWFYSHGVAVGDYDRDGWSDLLVTGWGRIALFHNVPNTKAGTAGRRFDDVSRVAGLDQGIAWATSAAFADFDGDGYPDLYVCQYVDWSFANHPACDYDGKTPDVCPPKKFNGLKHKVYRNNGNGSFVDVSDSCGIVPGGPKSSKGLGVLVVDVNHDCRPDVYVANDTVANLLYVNESRVGKIQFRECGREACVAFDEQGQANGSMGVDAGDPEGLGKPYLWVTNYEKELHALYKNESADGHSLFSYHTPASGIAAIGQNYVGWGTGFIDIENRGWEDLFIANGHAIRYPTSTSRRQAPVLLRNQGNGKFKDITACGGDYFRTQHLARGVALGDLDNDGRVDVAIAHMNESASILHNVAAAGNHWIGIELHRPGHADIVGSRVEVEAGGRKQTRFAKGGGSYCSAPDRRFIVGLGTDSQIEKVTVTWPDGKSESWSGIKPDQYVRIVQGEKAAKALGK